MKTQIILLLILSFFSLQIFAQTKTVTGTVTDDNNSFLSWVIICVNDTGKTCTDIDGNYSVKVNENDTLLFNLQGHIEQKIPVAGKLVIDVTLYRNPPNKEYQQSFGASGIPSNKKN